MSDAEMMRFMAGCMLAEGPAPSVETPLHSLLPHRVIAHTHDVATMSLTNVADGTAERLVNELFEGGIVYVPYSRPGFPLARSVSAMVDRIPPAAIGMTLAHHGLVVWGDDAEQAHARLVRSWRRSRSISPPAVVAGCCSAPFVIPSAARPRGAPAGLAEMRLPAVRGAVRGAPERAGPRHPPLRRRRRRTGHPGRGTGAGAHGARHGNARTPAPRRPAAGLARPRPGGARGGSSSPRCGAGWPPRARSTRQYHAPPRRAGRAPARRLGQGGPGAGARAHHGVHRQAERRDREPLLPGHARGDRRRRGGGPVPVLCPSGTCSSSSTGPWSGGRWRRPSRGSAPARSCRGTWW